MRHPSGIRVIRRETVHTLGPRDDEVQLLRDLLAEMTAGRVADIGTITFDWQDDGCHLAVYCDSYALLREVGEVREVRAER